jgi:hypothetical protein
MLATIDKHQDYEVAIKIELGRLEGSAMGQCSRAVQTLAKRSRASKRSNLGDFGDLNFVKYSAFGPK